MDKQIKTVTYEQFLEFDPCYDEEQLKEIAGDKKKWSALEILALDNVPAGDRLWAVLREELIDAPILHEFACRCAENALKLINNPDPRSIAAIEAKRRWLRNEITDEELDAAGDAAWAAARAAGDAAWAAAGAAARAAAWAAAWAAAGAAARAAGDAAWAAAGAAARAAAWAAGDAAWAAAWDGQIKLLVDMLSEEV